MFPFYHYVILWGAFKNKKCHWENFPKRSERKFTGMLWRRSLKTPPLGNISLGCNMSENSQGLKVQSQQLLMMWTESLPQCGLRIEGIIQKLWSRMWPTAKRWNVLLIIPNSAAGSFQNWGEVELLQFAHSKTDLQNT